MDGHQTAPRASHPRGLLRLALAPYFRLAAAVKALNTTVDEIAADIERDIARTRNIAAERSQAMEDRGA